ncbi:uncharacterized protein EHS24_008059 [Apiotrichum porosum]|uniref:Aminotransferase class I/classII large domain-containing protein n=1 Tax=Apiotrichum porosum TaxID=105984 RepID=A0A427XSQ1_9TREE|nr:uncharacterized protein EHS24_008059 [Apiotrichum porosum]RSH81864.1 hypothetical protein EHS24_008059 [Apiotrichum porosum]
MGQLDTNLQALLDKRKQKGRFRSLKEYDTRAGSGLTDFSSNDYLSITTDAGLREAYVSRIASEPMVLGSTGSRLLSGGTPSHRLLERRLADHFDAPSALLFNSGWDANVSFFGNAPQPHDWVVYDELVHASVHSGMRASRVAADRKVQFLHNDPESLAEVLQKITTESKKNAGKTKPTIFLAMESLYSMDGDFAPIPSLLDVLDVYVPRAQQCVIVDEAHSTGVYGSGGRGVVDALGEGTTRTGSGRVTVRLMTFGKGVGCSGAVLLASETVRSFLINFARPFIFSTALPLSTVFALESAWDFLGSSKGETRRALLVDTINYFMDRVGPLLAFTRPTILRLPDPTPVPFPDGRTLPPRPAAPIIGLLSPTPHALSAFLLERGFVVRPVVPPTVPPGGERVRICLRAGIDLGALDGLIRALAEWVKLKLADGEEEVRAKL